MVTQTPDDPVSTLTQGIGILGKRKSDNTLQFLSSIPAQEDIAGRTSFNTVFGEQIVATKLTTVMVNAVYGINLAKILTTVANGGTITAADSMLVATSSTATNGTALAESEHAVRYRAGEEFYALFTALFTTGVTGSQQFCGCISSTDGFAVGFNNTDFMICYRNGGSDTIIPQSSFNIDKMDGTGASGYVIDPTKLNLYRITFGWLGSANITFQHFTSTQNWVIFHEIKIAGTIATPHIVVPYLPVALEVVKTSGSENIIAKSGSWNAGVMGQPTTGISDMLHATGTAVVTLVAATETPLLTIRALPTLNSIINRIEAILLHWSVVSEGNKPVTYRIYKNATIDSGDFTNHETGVSVIEISTNSAITGGDLEIGTATAKSGSKDIDLEHLRMDLHKNNSYTITAESANASDVSTIITWREEF